MKCPGGNANVKVIEDKRQMHSFHYLRYVIPATRQPSFPRTFHSLHIHSCFAKSVCCTSFQWNGEVVSSPFHVHLVLQYPTVHTVSLLWCTWWDVQPRVQTVAVHLIHNVNEKLHVHLVHLRSKGLHLYCQTCFAPSVHMKKGCMCIFTPKVYQMQNLCALHPGCIEEVVWGAKKWTR